MENIRTVVDNVLFNLENLNCVL